MPNDDEDNPYEYWEPSEEEEFEARQRYLDGDLEEEKGGGDWYEPPQKEPPPIRLQRKEIRKSSGCLLLCILISLSFLFFASCSSNMKLEGAYYYRGSIPGNPDSKIVAEAKKEMKDLMGQEGLYTAFIFKGEKTVMVKSLGVEFAASYEIDGDYISITATDGELVLKYIDQNTLHGEGFASGLYTKLKPGEKPPMQKEIPKYKKPQRKRKESSPDIHIELKLPPSDDTTSNQ